MSDIKELKGRRGWKSLLILSHRRYEIASGGKALAMTVNGKGQGEKKSWGARNE